MLFASGARGGVLIVDPIEARVAIWDIEKRFWGVPDLPDAVTADFRNLSTNAGGYCFSIRHAHLASDTVWRSNAVRQRGDGGVSLCRKANLRLFMFCRRFNTAKHGECPL